MGRAEPGDTITYTFNKSLAPYLPFFGWDGSPRAVKVDFGIQAGNSILEVEDTNGNLLPLGTINLGAKYSDALQFTGSMRSTGSTLTVTLGTPGAGTRSTVLVPTTMNWSSYGTTAVESGLPDVEF